MEEDVLINHNGVNVSVNDMKKYYKENPDPDFSEAHNKATIKAAIKRAEQLRNRKRKDYHDALDERVSATASYLRYLDRGKSGTPEQYFGKKQLAELRGQQIAAELQAIAANGQKLWKLTNRKNA